MRNSVFYLNDIDSYYKILKQWASNKYFYQTSNNVKLNFFPFL